MASTEGHLKLWDSRKFFNNNKASKHDFSLEVDEGPCRFQDAHRWDYNEMNSVKQPEIVFETDGRPQIVKFSPRDECFFASAATDNSVKVIVDFLCRHPFLILTTPTQVWATNTLSQPARDLGFNSDHPAPSQGTSAARFSLEGHEARVNCLEFYQSDGKVFF